MKARKQLTINNINYIVLDCWYAMTSNKHFARIQHPEKYWETKNIEVTAEQAKEL